ncbi:MAG: hypothetical protein GY853_14445 [PVC group bacterium]|nr:hypothetical protein [PVC group bacterium]
MKREDTICYLCENYRLNITHITCGDGGQDGNTACDKLDLSIDSVPFADIKDHFADKFNGIIDGETDKFNQAIDEMKNIDDEAYKKGIEKAIGILKTYF